jgi:hypothetical protein
MQLHMYTFKVYKNLSIADKMTSEILLQLVWNQCRNVIAFTSRGIYYSVALCAMVLYVSEFLYFYEGGLKL